MTIPARANIIVVSIRSLKGGQQEAERLISQVPGAKLSRCEVCFTKVLLAPSTIGQKLANPGHRLVCRECVARHAPEKLGAITRDNVTAYGGEKDLETIDKALGKRS